MRLSVSDTDLTFGYVNELHHHIVHVIVLQVGVISYWRVTAGLVPAKVIRRVVSVRKDPWRMGGGQEGKMFTRVKSPRCRKCLSWSFGKHS